MKDIFPAILGEKETRLLQDKAIRNDGLQKLALSLRAKQSQWFSISQRIANIFQDGDVLC